MSPSPRAAEHAIFAKDRTVTASEGTPLAHTVVGDGDRTPIAFVNGWSCPDTYWAEIGPRMIEAGHRGVFIDTRGHGQSGLPRSPELAASGPRPEDIAVERLARDVVEVSDDAGIERAALVGSSSVA